MLTNGVPFVVSYLAALGLGAVVVPLNPTSPAPELERQIATVGATLVVIDRSCTATWANVDAAAVPTVTAAVTTDPEGPDDLIPFERLLESEPVERLDVEADHLAALLFTSGTAGAPRAAMLTHGNLRANIDQSRSASGHVNADDVVYGVLPVFHIFGLNVVLGLALTVGATVVLVQRFDPSTALQSIARSWRHGDPWRAGHVGRVHATRRPARRCLRHRAAGVVGCLAPAVVGGRGDARPIRRRHLRGLRAHRGVADRDHLDRRAGEAGLRRTGPRGRGGAVRERRRRRSRRRRRRGVGARRQRVRRLSRRPRGHGGGAQRGRLVADRRHGDRGRRRVPVPRRPGQGPRDRVGFQRLSRPRSKRP